MPGGEDNLACTFFLENGRLHSEKGPAFFADKIQYHYLAGEYYTKENWKEEMYKRNLEKVV